MGRNAKPVDLLVIEGKSHLTKEQIQKRKAAEIKLNGRKIVADDAVMSDQRALKEFNFLKKMYKDLDFVGTLDSHIINQYCMAVSELDDLVFAMSQAREKMRNAGTVTTRKKYMNQVLELDTEVRLKRAEMLKLSDRLYLNPVARTKNLPKKQDKKEADPNAGMFGDTG